MGKSLHLYLKCLVFLSPLSGSRLGCCCYTFLSTQMLCGASEL